MALLWKAGLEQTKLLEKTTQGNSGSEKLGLTRKKDLKRTKKETELE